MISNCKKIISLDDRSIPTVLLPAESDFMVFDKENCSIIEIYGHMSWHHILLTINIDFILVKFNLKYAKSHALSNFSYEGQIFGGC